jgi:exodeoxyribonuclease III
MSMRIATFNVNGIKARLPALLDWLEQTQPDVVCLYAPNGNPQPGPKFDYKLAWMDRLHEHASNLHAAHCAVVIAGDFNVIPEERDAYRPERWVKDALFQPEVRERYRRLLDSGWIDAIRHLHPDQSLYTFWEYWRDAYARDDGIRIDHLLLNKHAAQRLVDAGVDRSVRGGVSPSDHAPAWVVIE